MSSDLLARRGKDADDLFMEACFGEQIVGGIQGGVPPWSQGVCFSSAREGEAGSSIEDHAPVGRGNAKRFPL